MGPVLLLRGSPAVQPAQRLDGRSKALLAASIKTLPYDTPGWITDKQAKQLFSQMADDYAFGEMDEVGKSNIADFAAHVTPGCSFEFMPVEGRVYFRGIVAADHDRGVRELSMAKSRKEKMQLLANLLAEYAAFQRRRPDLPQGDLLNLSEQELDLLVTEFQRDRAAEADDTDPTPPQPLLH
jgi:hypothetical protein